MKSSTFVLVVLVTLAAVAVVGGQKKRCKSEVGEEYKTCGSLCPVSCHQKNTPENCKRDCVRGCFCQNGLIRDKSTGKCVKQKECSTQRPKYQKITTSKKP